MAIGPRRRARIVALQALYEADNSRHDPQDNLQRIIADQRIGKAPAAFAKELVDAVLSRREEIDGKIAATAPAWPVSALVEQRPPGVSLRPAARAASVNALLPS